jgi:hypothetical protein
MNINYDWEEECRANEIKEMENFIESREGSVAATVRIQSVAILLSPYITFLLIKDLEIWCKLRL